jgi:glycosyltransferase involved in cell wall biosynthesis
MIYQFFLLKRQLEDLLIMPFIWIGRNLKDRLIDVNPFDILLLFSSYHIGGAEKVHLQIASALKGRKALVVFTKKSTAAVYKQAFIETGHQIIDVSRFTDNKFQYWNNLIYRGVFASLIENQKSNTIVFNGQSNFGYKLSPWLNKSIVQIDLIHAFSSFSWIRIPFLSFYQKTIMISNRSIAEHKTQYQKIGVPEHEVGKIMYLPNGISLPKLMERKELDSAKLRVLYVGRATGEKRVHLIAAIARSAAMEGIPCTFSMVGDVQNAIPKDDQSFVHFYGAINNAETLNAIYAEHDVLIMTSLHEGFPLTIMEGMASGCVILSTPVGDIPYHVHHKQNGYLFSNTTDENKIVEEALTYLKQIMENPDLFKVMSSNNLTYAKKEFDLSIFEQRYQTMFDQLK